MLEFRKSNKDTKSNFSEFYYISITSKCHGECPWCYSKANSKGENYSEICETWKMWMNTLDENSKPHSVNIGSIGEPTEHPDFIEFLESVYNSNVLVSYTTNGIILGTPGDPRANDILKATEKYCKSVSLSLGNNKLQKYQKYALESLSETKVKIYLNYLISDINSVKEFINNWKFDKNKKYTHILIPIVDSFGKVNISDEVLKMLKSEILNYEMNNIEFGSKSHNNENLYPDSLYSKNVILKNKTIIITKNSFDLRPIKLIKL